MIGLYLITFLLAIVCLVSLIDSLLSSQPNQRIKPVPKMASSSTNTNTVATINIKSAKPSSRTPLVTHGAPAPYFRAFAPRGPLSTNLMAACAV